MGRRKGNQATNGRRKRKQEIPETRIRDGGGDDGDEPMRSREEEDGNKGEEEGRRFFACYLLTSVNPRHKASTYIGFTVNPRRRIRQHNGEIRCGAWRTKKKRPWEMILCIYGFPTNVKALQFEWAWQHPTESLAVRKAAAALKSLRGLANKIKLAYTMLTLPAWQSLNLTVNFFSSKYKIHAVGCPNLPAQMKVQVCSMDELPCYTGTDWNVCENDELGDDEGRDEGIGASEEETSVSIEGQRAECFPPRKEHGREPACCNNKSPEGSPSSNLSRSYSTEVSVEDWGIREDEVLVKSSNDPSEIEVVDVFTPSPCYKINSRNKKSKDLNSFPQIVDLTNSPIYV